MLPKHYLPNTRYSNAFTLIELVVVMGIMSVLATLGLLVSMDFYRSYAFNSERDIVVALLQKARNQSLNNMGQKEHGVHFESGKYVIYEGASFVAGDGANQEVVAHPGITNSFSGDIKFTQLSAAGAGASMTISDGKRSAVISVNSEGKIEWQ